jgi:hypothetical protein
MSAEQSKASGAGGNTSTTAGDRFNAENEPVTDSLTDASQYVSEAISYGKWYLAAQADRIRSTIRNALLMAVIGIVGAIIALTVLVTATVLLCVGVANSIGMVLGGRLWAGDLITGLLVVGSLSLIALVFSRRMIRSAGQRTQAEYEKKRARN